MNLHEASAWVLQHGEIIGLLAAVAAGIGALYRPTRDLLKALPKFIWFVIKYTVLTVWTIIWPIRKLFVLLYVKLAAQHVEKFFDKIFDWFEKREAAKERLRDSNSPIKPTEL